MAHQVKTMWKPTLDIKKTCWMLPIFDSHGIIGHWFCKPWASCILGQIHIQLIIFQYLKDILTLIERKSTKHLPSSDGSYLNKVDYLTTRAGA